MEVYGGLKDIKETYELSFLTPKNSMKFHKDWTESIKKSEGDINYKVEITKVVFTQTTYRGIESKIPSLDGGVMGE